MSTINSQSVSSAAAALASNATSSSGGSTTGSATSGTLSLKPTDFINMMITQLQNQDPLQPTSSSDILAQMSQIGQLQASDTMQTSMQSLVLQDQLASASNFIGKSVQGMDLNNNTITGVVNSIHVDTGVVNLQLDSGQSLQIGRVTDIVNPTAATGTGTGTSSNGN